jgi:FAD-linked sulfhydryl oxidase
MTHLPNNREKLCRICDDFKVWAGKQTRTEQQEAHLPEESPLSRTVTNPRGERLACPPNKEELGRATWTFLHTMAAYYPEKISPDMKESTSRFLQHFSRIYPCDYCAQHLQMVMEQDPPRTNSQPELSQWLCDVHNQVNQLLGKPLFDCRKLNERWRDGPPDASCE